MGGMEFNKIFAAILIAGIIAMLGGFVAKQLVHPHKLEKDAFAIEAAEDAGAGGPAAAAGPEPIMAMIAAADAAKGEKLSKACAACHTFTKGGPAGVGPNLWGVVGGPKDHMPGYAYSGALLEVGAKNWTYEELNKFLYKPKAYAPNTKMGFAGLKKGEDRAALIAWLRNQADAPKALPTDAEIAAEQADLGGAAAGDKAAAPPAEQGGGAAPAADAGRKGETTPATAPADAPAPGSEAKGETSKAPKTPTAEVPAKH